MKFCSMNGPSESEVESLLMSPCWGPTQSGSQDQYLLDGHKLLLEHELDSLPSDTDQKNSLDVLDNLLLNSTSLNALSDLKPLPPFTGYTGHLSINGISGHHYHAIAQRLPDESNNNYLQSAYQQQHQQQQQQQHNQHHHQQQQQQQHQQQQQQQHHQSTNPTTTSIQLAAAASSGTSPLSNVTLGSAGNSSSAGSSHSHSSAADHNLVSSSTCLPESVLSAADAADACLNDVKLFADSQLDNKLYSVADSCIMSNGGGVVVGGNVGDSLTPTLDQVADSLHTSGVRIYKDLTEYVDMNSIDDIAAIIGSAIADTTVPNQLDKDDGNDTRDSWMDLESWIGGTMIQPDAKLVVSQQDSLNEFILPSSPVHTSNSTLQSLLTHGYMPLLHNRLQNGPPTTTTGNPGANNGAGISGANGGVMKSEAPSSTSYCNELPSATSSSSPPGSVVSTTDNLMINPRYITNPGSHQYQLGGNGLTSGTATSSMKADGICSPDMLGNYPHTTTVTPTGTSKAKRSRAQKKASQAQNAANAQMGGGGGVGQGAPQQMNAISPSSVNSFNANDLSGLLGKEKPVHRCSICNRGFLNKSNIKVHLRTHTGEKPFRCDVCAKAFRQKAHLLKHQQIHKRIGRD